MNRSPEKIINEWWESSRSELLRAFTTAPPADEPWDGSEERDLTPADEDKVSAWVDRHGKLSGKRSASRKKGQGVDK